MATGDIRVLAENYDALLRHCAYMRAMAVDETVKYGLGDWCAPFDGLSLYVNMTKSVIRHFAMRRSAHRNDGQGFLAGARMRLVCMRKQNQYGRHSESIFMISKRTV